MMACKQRLSAIGVAAGFVGVMLGIAWAESCPTQCGSGKVMLGISGPMSGQAVASAFGAQTIKPVQVGIHELNAAGGLMGIPVELAVADDQCEPGLAMNVAKRQVEQDKIKFVIGPVCPAAAMAATSISGPA